VNSDNPIEVQGILKTYHDNIQGQLHCFDRIIINGTFDEIAHPQAMSYQLHQNGIKLLEYGKVFAQQLRLDMRDTVEKIAKDEGLTIEHVNFGTRKESLVSKVLERRGNREGIVHIISAMERCRCFKVGKNKVSGYLELQWDSGKCLHYYIYFMDAEYGLCYFRIPTWAPFRLQVYLNGHEYLERQMLKCGINFSKLDNCFIDISDFKKAQELADSLDPFVLHEKLNAYTQRFCGCSKRWKTIHWSFNQVEYATDIVFKNNQILPHLYDQLVKTAVCEVGAADVYNFMGKRLTSASAAEVSSHLNTRVEGTRIKHTLDKCSIKMYDKQDRVLRIETTCNDVSFFKHHREVLKRDGSIELKNASVKKTIYSLGVLQGLMHSCNRRYYEFVSQLQDHTRGRLELAKLSEKAIDEKGKSYRGINFFNATDLTFINTLVRGENNISGFTNRMFREHLGWNSNKISRMIKRFRNHKLIKAVRGTYKYYLTNKAKKLLIAGLQLKDRIIIPALAS